MPRPSRKTARPPRGKDEPQRGGTSPGAARGGTSPTGPGGGGGPTGAAGWLPLASCMALAFVLYGNTVGHRYALDDTVVLTRNAYVKAGLAGLPDIFTHDALAGTEILSHTGLTEGGRYRPLSMAMFAVEYQLFGLSPGPSHLINVLLFGLTGAALFALFRRLPLERASGPWPWLATAATLLFLAHPIHTEVVANIKGRDELLALLLSLAAFHAALTAVERGGMVGPALACASFLGACLA